MNKSIPHPPRKPIIGNLHQIKGNEPIQKLMQLTKEFDGLMEMKIVKKKILIATGQKIVNELSNEKLFYKMVTGPVERIRSLAGDGLFTAHNHEPNWQKAHNILLPGFGFNVMKGYFPMMLDIAKQLVQKWDAAAINQDSIDVTDDMTRLTLDTIGLCGFDFRFDSFNRDNMHPFIEYMNTCLEETQAANYRLPIINTLNIWAKKRVKFNINALNKIVDDVIKERKANPSENKNNDFLNLMLEGVDKSTGEKLSDENIRYQIITFLVAGHETTSGLLSFAIYYMLNNPEVLRKATAEVDSVFGPDVNATPEYKNITELKYLNQILKETLRLWAPAPGYRLAAHKDTVVGGKYLIKKDQPIMVLIPGLHRQTDVWGDNPELFDPENFSKENEANHPDNCYKPFGNGMRACIGRQFAMVEAQLVLAMILQKFKLVNHTNYKLKIKETLTLKPDNFNIKIKIREDSDRPNISDFAAKLEKEKSKDTPKSFSYHGTEMTILFGSNMGLSEGLAHDLMDSAKKRGFKAEISCLDDWSKTPKDNGVVLVICSTYNGSPPDNAKVFYDSLENTSINLKGTSFAVFGCGNSDWKTFQVVPRTINQKFKEFGSQQLLEIGEGNVNEDFETAYENWLSSFWEKVSKQYSLENDGQPEVENKLIMTVSNETVSENIQGDSKLMPLSVLENRELQNVELSKRSTKHIEVALPETSSYCAGDHLAVHPINSKELVQRVLNRFQLKGDTVVRLEQENEFSTSLPINKSICIDDLLANYLELQDVATRKNVKLLHAVTFCPPEKKRLEEINAADSKIYNEYVHAGKRSVLDLLEEFPASEITFEDFLLLLPPLRPRYYSISSGPLQSKNSCSVTVSVLNIPAKNGKGLFKGVCSNYLETLSEGETFKGYIKNAGDEFRLPNDNKTPIIMIGPGTGFAPFRGFLQERLAQKNNGVQLGKALLFYGARNRNQDFIYQQELENFEKEGVVELITAFSRPDDESKKAYVQNKIRENSEDVLDIINSNGRIYVCGDGSRMEPDVRNCLNELMHPNNESDGVDQLISENRYSLDVWISN